VIDLHCHILHALDDGPQTAAESMLMAQSFAGSGYCKVAATPHMIFGTAWMPSVDRIRTGVAELNQAIHDEGLALRIVSGMEIALDPRIPELLDAGRLLTLGDSSFLLIELSIQQAPPGWEQVIFSILAKGFSILLAHPERCIQLASNPDLIERFIQSGVYLQVNWGSFLGQYGRPAIRAAQLLANNGWIHCLATDSHYPGGHEPSQIQAAARELLTIIGQENFQRISMENPLRLLKGWPPLPMTMTDTMIGKRKRQWWRFWSTE